MRPAFPMLSIISGFGKSVPAVQALKWVSSKKEQLKTVRGRRGEGAEKGKGAQMKDEGGFGRSTTHRDSKRNKEGFVDVNFDLLEVMRPRQCGL